MISGSTSWQRLDREVVELTLVREFFAKKKRKEKKQTNKHKRMFSKRLEGCEREKKAEQLSCQEMSEMFLLGSPVLCSFVDLGN